MRYYMLNKPSGVITAVSDKNYKTVMDCFPSEIRSGLFPIGRLDKDTEGLLLVTDDGELSFKLTRPEFNIEKRYFFRAFGEISEKKIKMLREGVFIGNGTKLAKPAFLTDIVLSTVEHDKEFIPEDIRAHTLKNPKGATFSGTITVTEGKYHEVKLLLHSVGCKIFYLKRTSVGAIVLDTVLKPEEFRELNSSELEFAEKCKNIFIPL